MTPSRRRLNWGLGADIRSPGFRGVEGLAEASERSLTDTEAHPEFTR
jgi:hypothetical protein